MRRHDGADDPSRGTPWCATHRLLWVPSFGIIRAWYVRCSQAIRDGRSVWLAQTLEEARLREPARWARDDEAGQWTWDGLRGYRGEAGRARLERLPVGDPAATAQPPRRAPRSAFPPGWA